MNYFFAVLSFFALGLALPICSVACIAWLLGDEWNWRHTTLAVLVLLSCINAPAYSAAVFGFLPWDFALGSHVFAIGLFGVATLINGGNPTEAYALAILILCLSVSIAVVRREWREPNENGSAAAFSRELPPAENKPIHVSPRRALFYGSSSSARTT